MTDEKFALLRTHSNNISRYRRLLKIKLTEFERQFIERRLSEEQSAMERLSFLHVSPHLRNSEDLGRRRGRNCAVIVGGVMKKAAGSISSGLTGLKIDWNPKPCQPGFSSIATATPSRRVRNCVPRAEHNGCCRQVTTRKLCARSTLQPDAAAKRAPMDGGMPGGQFLDHSKKPIFRIRRVSGTLEQIPVDQAANR